MSIAVSPFLRRASALLAFSALATIGNAQIFDFETNLQGFAVRDWNVGTLSVSPAWSTSGTNSMRISIPSGSWHANVATWGGGDVPTEPALRAAIVDALPNRDNYRFVFDLALDRSSTSEAVSFNVAFQSSDSGFNQHFGVGSWDAAPGVTTGFDEKLSMFLNLSDTNLPFVLDSGQWFQMTFGSGGIPAAIHVDNIRLEVIPEPSTYALLGGIGALAAVMILRRRKARA